MKQRKRRLPADKVREAVLGDSWYYKPPPPVASWPVPRKVIGKISVDDFFYDELLQDHFAGIVRLGAFCASPTQYSNQVIVSVDSDAPEIARIAHRIFGENGLVASV